MNDFSMGSNLAVTLSVSVRGWAVGGVFIALCVEPAGGGAHFKVASSLRSGSEHAAYPTNP